MDMPSFGISPYIIIFNFDLFYDQNRDQLFKILILFSSFKKFILDRVNKCFKYSKKKLQKEINKQKQ